MKGSPLPSCFVWPIPEQGWEISRGSAQIKRKNTQGSTVQGGKRLSSLSPDPISGGKAFPCCSPNWLIRVLEPGCNQHNPAAFTAVLPDGEQRDRPPFPRASSHVRAAQVQQLQQEEGYWAEGAGVDRTYLLSCKEQLLVWGWGLRFVCYAMNFPKISIWNDQNTLF